MFNIVETFKDKEFPSLIKLVNEYIKKILIEEKGEENV